MATKKFAQMATKKLQKLVNDPATSEEDKVAIQAIIDKRQAAATPAASQESAELSPEEQAAINTAEAEASKQNDTSGTKASEEKKKAKAGRKTTVKMTAEELDAECDKMEKEAKGHRCEAILPGTAIKVGGFIKSVLKEKRAMRCYLLIQSDVTEDNPTGKQFYKVSSEVTVLPEVVELKKKVNGKMRKERKDDEEWLAGADAIVEAAGEFVGRQIDLGEDKGIGTIETIIKDKRSQTIFFRVTFTDENNAKKFTHKAVHFTKDEAEGGKIVVSEPAGLLELTDDKKELFDELQAKWQTRAERQPRTALTPEEKVLRAEAALEKAKKTLEKAQEAVQCKQLEYDNAKAALDAKHDTQENAAVEAEANKENAQEAGDLM